MTDDEEQDRILDAVRKLNPKQREIVLGIIATLQIFDDDEAAARWIERNQAEFKAQIKDAE